jgi:hypothetical protein
VVILTFVNIDVSIITMNQLYVIDVFLASSQILLKHNAKFTSLSGGTFGYKNLR